MENDNLFLDQNKGRGDEKVQDAKKNRTHGYHRYDKWSVNKKGNHRNIHGWKYLYSTGQAFERAMNNRYHTTRIQKEETDDFAFDSCSNKNVNQLSKSVVDVLCVQKEKKEEQRIICLKNWNIGLASLDSITQENNRLIKTFDAIVYFGTFNFLEALRKFRFLKEIPLFTIHDIEMKDAKMHYQDFKLVVEKMLSIVDSYDNGKKVLFVCEKGVNRSVTMAIAYAITRKNSGFEDAISYIDEIKLEKCPTWNSLTNISFRNLLRTLYHNKTQFLLH